MKILVYFYCNFYTHIQIYGNSTRQTYLLLDCMCRYHWYSHRPHSCQTVEQQGKSKATLQCASCWSKVCCFKKMMCFLLQLADYFLSTSFLLFSLLLYYRDNVVITLWGQKTIHITATHHVLSWPYVLPLSCCSQNYEPYNEKKKKSPLSE